MKLAITRSADKVFHVNPVSNKAMNSIFSSVGTRLSAGFGLLILLAVALTGIGYFRMAAMQRDLETAVGDNIIRIRLINAMREAVAMQGIALRDVVLQIDFSHKKKELALARESRKRYQAAVADLRAHLAIHDDSSLEQRIAKTEALDAQVQLASTELLEFALAEQNAEAGTVVRDKIRVAQIELRNEIESILAETEAQAQQSATVATQAARFASSLMLGLCALAVILGAAIAFLIIRSITRPLADTVGAANRIASGDLTVTVRVERDDEIGRLQSAFGDMTGHLRHLIGNVKNSAQEASNLSQRLYVAAQKILSQADQQSAMAEATHRSMQRSTESISATSMAVEKVVEAADHARSIAQSGHESIRSGAEYSQNIVRSVAATSISIAELSKAIERIVSVTQVISEIAEQTNMLALNAAIEAARAGEQGRGFAVVADEVRKLAERTSTSTADIKSIIDGVAERTHEAVTAMDEVQHSVTTGADQNAAALHKFQLILSAADGVVAESEAISRASREQTSASLESRTTVEQIAEIAAASADSIRQLEESAQTLTGTADQLHKLVDRFRVT